MTTKGRAFALRPYVSRLGRSWPGPAAHRAIDGALVSLDLRGFTDLTRRFSARGREGAEEVTNVISTCFAPLVDAVEARGGDVVAFGGDALLALFDGTGAEARAAAAAIALRDSVGALGAVPTSLGRIRLSARIAIAAGTIDCYRIGARQRALAVAGPVVSRTLALERLAKAREIVADRSIVERATGCRRGGPRDEGFLLIAAPDVPDSVGRDRARRDGAAAFVAPSLRPWLEAGVGAGEHRDLTVAFISLRGLDRLRARGGPDGVLDALERFAAAVDTASERQALSWVNTDAQRDGVKVTLVAGVPAAGDRDDARLVRGVHEVMSALPDLTVAAGASSCRAFIGDIGSASRRGLMVMGDGINLAARLASRARPHQLLADPSLASRVPELRRVALTSFRARGFPDPVRPYRLDETTDGDGAAPAAFTALLVTPGALHGRTRERDVLLRALESARNGNGSVVEIVGEPGAGKSRLAAELVVACDARDVVVVAGDPTSARTPFAGLRSDLRPRVGAAAARRRDLAPLFRPPRGDAPPMTEQAQRRLHEALLDALDDGTTLVIVVDDAQWLDEASRALLAAVGAGAAGRRWLLCNTRRPGGDAIPVPAGTPVHRLRLRTLPAAAVRAIARDAAVAPVSSAQLDRIVDASGGNPLFASQLAVAAPQLGDAVPERIERVIAARVDALAPHDRARLREVAVIGREAPLDFVVAVTGEAVLGRRSSWTGLAGLVELTGQVVRFEHELVRQVAYDGLSFARRRALHAACADALVARTTVSPSAAAGDLAGAIAWHAEGASRPDICWTWSRRAGAIAAAGGAFDDARVQYERAIRASRALRSVSRSDVATTLTALGDAADRAGEPANATRAYTQARRTIGKDSRNQQGASVALLASKLGVLAERQGNYTAAARWFRTGLGELGGGPEDDRARARLLLDFGSLRQYEGRYDDAAALSREARALAGKRRARQLVAESELQLEMALGAVGDAASEEHFARAERALRALGDDDNLATLYINGGLTAYEAGDWRTAEERYAAALTALAHGGHPGARATVRNNQAMLLLDRGCYDEANALLDDARRDWLALGFEYGVAVTIMSAGRIAAFTGDATQAQARFREARRAMKRLGTSAYDAELAVYDVERLIADRRWAAALRRVAPARALLADGDRPALAVTLTRLHGVALAGVGRAERSERVLRDALADARRIDARVEIAYTLDALLAVSTQKQLPLRRERDGLAHTLGIERFPFATARARRGRRDRAR